jgi:hypothetical protein
MSSVVQMLVANTKQVASIGGQPLLTLTTHQPIAAEERTFHMGLASSIDLGLE